jgi:hypothetical protein
MHPLPCELCVFALNQRKQRLYVEPIHPKARHIPRKAARLRARCAGFRSSPRRNRRRPLGAPPTGSAGFPAGQLGAPPTGSAGFPAGQLGAPAFQPANWERRLSSRPTGSAGFPAGHWERRLSSRPLGAPAFQPANWERRLSSRPLGAPAFQPATGSAGFPAGQLGAPAFQPASPDAGSMPASGDLAAEAILHLPSRMFSSDGFSSGSRVFAISHVFGTALSRAKDVPAGKPALPVAGAPSKPAFPVR